MLDEKEIKIIKEFIEQGKSNYWIGKKRNHSPNTIQDIREKMEKTGQKQTQEDVLVKSPIETVRRIIKEIDGLIETKQLNDKEEKIWEKRREQLQEMMKVEVDDKIPKERADAVQKRDKEWNEIIGRSYVKKEVATDLESTIHERDATITSLRNENERKDRILEKDQTVVSDFFIDVQNKNIHIRNLLEDNYYLRNYIENRFDDEVRAGQEQLGREREVLNAEKTRFFEYMNEHLSNLNNYYTEVEERRKAVETRENDVVKREEKIQKRENELEAAKNTWNEQCSQFMTNIKTRLEEVYRDYIEELVSKCFDKHLDETIQKCIDITVQQIK